MAALPVVTLAWASAFRADARASFSADLFARELDWTAKSPDLEDPARGPRKDEVVIQAEPPRAPTGPRFSDQVEPWLPLLVSAWGLGVVFLSIRLLGGWLLIQGLTRRGTRPVEESWALALARLSGRLGLRQAVRLLESTRVQVPMVVGWWRPVILLPAIGHDRPLLGPARADPGA